MSLRFRKSISIIPGVRLNFSKTGMSLSAGVPGFRKTISTTGRVTTSIGIPGTGLSYVTTETNYKHNPEINATQVTNQEYYNETDANQSNDANSIVFKRVTREAIQEIHKVADEPIDWTEVLLNSKAPDDSYNHELWEYCHKSAEQILSGNIDTYLKVIEDINPLSDLLEYGAEFEFWVDDPLKIEVDYKIKTNCIGFDKKGKDYEDFVCSVSIRIARDMFALLPVKNVIVHAVDFDETILSVCFDKNTISNIKFNFIDPSDTIMKFKHNKNFKLNQGFTGVNRVSR